MQNKAFSLVELSMVLVIIAVLVTGVTGGARLMEVARLNKVALQLNEIANSVETFELTYKALPGDMVDAQSYFGSTLCVDHASHTELTCNGDGNNEIGSVYTTEGALAESSYAYLHMQLAGTYNGKYTPHSLSDSSLYSTISEINTPNVKVGDNTAHYAFWGTNSFGDTRYAIYLGRVWLSNDANFGKPLGSAFSYNTLVKIDRKIDDGVLNTGHIRLASGLTHSCTSSSPEGIACYLKYFESSH